MRRRFLFCWADPFRTFAVEHAHYDQGTGRTEGGWITGTRINTDMAAPAITQRRKYDATGDMANAKSFV